MPMKATLAWGHPIMSPPPTQGPMHCSGWPLTFWAPIWLPQRAAHPPLHPSSKSSYRGGGGRQFTAGVLRCDAWIVRRHVWCWCGRTRGERPINNLPKAMICRRCCLRGRMTRMTTTFDRTSAPRGKEWLGLRPRRLLSWSEPHPCRLKHNNQMAAGRGLVILRQQICRYCSCWWRQWRQWQQRCDAIGGEALV
jgi:hypothetical protein